MWELCSVISNDSALTLSFGMIVYHPLVRLSHPVVWSGSCLEIRRTGQLEGTLFESAYLNQGTSTGQPVFRTHRGIGSVAHCSWSQDIDLFKFQLSYCYNPLQDTGPITSAVLGHLVRTHVPLIFLHWDKKSYRLSGKCATLNRGRNTGVSLTNFMETMCFVISISFHRTTNLWSHVLDHKRCV